MAKYKPQGNLAAGARDKAKPKKPKRVNMQQSPRQKKSPMRNRSY